MTLYWILFIGIAVVSWVVSAELESKFKKYSKEPLSMTGREVAEKMLRDHGINDVQITCIKGQLTDHYNPATKTLTLDKESVEKYLKNGAQPSSRVAYILSKNGVKLPEWVKLAPKKTAAAKHADKLRKNQPKEEAPEATEEASEAPAEA